MPAGVAQPLERCRHVLLRIARPRAGWRIDEAERPLRGEFPPGGLRASAPLEARAHGTALGFGPSPLEAKHQPLVAWRQSIHRLGLAKQRRVEATHLQPRLASGRVAGQPCDGTPHHDAALAQRDVGHEALQPRALRRPTAGVPPVIIDACAKRVWPAHVLGGSGAAGVTRRTCTLRQPLGQGRVAAIPEGFSAEVMGVDCRVGGRVQAVPSLGGMDGRGLVASNLTPAASAGPAGAPWLSAAPGLGRSKAEAALRGAAAQRPQASSPSCTSRQASTGTVAPSPAERSAARRVASALPRSGLEPRVSVVGIRPSWLLFGG